MVTYTIYYTKNATTHIKYLKQTKLDKKAKELIDILKKDPLQNPPHYEKLVGNLKYLYSRRINIKHRLVYQILEKEKIVKIISMWSHYEF